MAEDTGTGALIPPIKSAGKKAGSGDKAKPADDTGGLGGATIPGASGGGNPFGQPGDEQGDVTTSDLDSAKVELVGSGDDALGLHEIFENKKPDTVAGYRSAIASLSQAKQQQLAGILANAGVIASKSTPYTPTEVESGFESALTETLMQGSKGKTPTLTEYLGKRDNQTSTADSSQTAALQSAMTDNLTKIATDYGVPVSAAGIASHVNGYLSSGLDASQANATFTQYAQSLAAGLYPSFAPQIESGISTTTLLDPYKELAAKTLGVSADSIDFTQPLWAAALNGTTDQKTGRAAPMTLSQWSNTLMSNPAYGYQNTDEAKNAAGSLTASLLKLFGKLPDESFSTSTSGPTPDLAAT